MQPTKEERIQYCAKYGTFINTLVKHRQECKCDNCGKNNLTVYLESNNIMLCLSCVEILNYPQDHFNPFDYLSDMGVKKELYFSSKHNEPKFNYNRMMCDIR